jgi:hypothetical protein
VKLPAECINAVVAWWAERWIPNDTREAFRAALRLRLEAFEHDAPAGYCGTLVALDCDYDPRSMLLDATRDTGVECRGYLYSAQGLLPSKHSVVIWLGRAEAKAGYGAEWITLWKAES